MVKNTIKIGQYNKINQINKCNILKIFIEMCIRDRLYVSDQKKLRKQ